MECNQTSTCMTSATKEDTTASYMYIYRAIVISISTILIIFGNVANITIIPRMNSMSKVSRIFFVNLSIADLMVGLSIGVPALVTTIVNGVWLFGEPYCYLSGLLHVTACSVSMTTLAAISIVRYVAVTRPFRYRMISGRKCVVACSLLWLYCTIVIVSPIADQATIVANAANYGFCTVRWVKTWPALWSFLTNMLPCIIAPVVFGVKITIALRRYHIPGERTSNNDSNGRENKALRLTIVTIICFGAFWLPYAAVRGTRLFEKSLAFDIPMLVHFSAMWLGNANSFVNVCIYSAIYPEFRSNLKRFLLCRRPCGRNVSSGMAVTTVPMRPVIGGPKEAIHGCRLR